MTVVRITATPAISQSIPSGCSKPFLCLGIDNGAKIDEHFVDEAGEYPFAQDKGIRTVVVGGSFYKYHDWTIHTITIAKTGQTPSVVSEDHSELIFEAIG